jgi:D-alanyl-D-alanine carboxypeptidase
VGWSAAGGRTGRSSAGSGGILPGRGTTLSTVAPLASLLAAVVLAGPPSATSRPPAFSAEVGPTRWIDIRSSWRRDCPVHHSELRLVRLSYWGFDGSPHVGRLVVNRRVTRNVVTVFRHLYTARFPIRRMVPVSAYGGSDDASMAADNTSGFNCRFVSGTRRWSMHAYGLAIDVNPVENPYVSGAGVRPLAGRRYLSRARTQPGMAVEGGVLVRAFDAVGWHWGGRWSGSPDYQHFSTNGR